MGTHRNPPRRHGEESRQVHNDAGCRNETQDRVGSQHTGGSKWQGIRATSAAAPAAQFGFTKAACALGTKPCTSRKRTICVLMERITPSRQINSGGHGGRIAIRSRGTACTRTRVRADGSCVAHNDSHKEETVKSQIEMRKKGLEKRQAKAYKRRRKVAKLQAEGLSGPEIAARLGEKPRTIYSDFAILKRQKEKLSADKS